MKFFVRTLGCKVNWLDGARLTAALQANGHELAEHEAQADLVLVNSCTVTAEADRKSRQVVNAAQRSGQRVVVSGCGPRVDPVRWHEQAPGSEIIGTERDLALRFGVDLEHMPVPRPSRTRLPVAIQTGCDDVCTFCITRVARGTHRSLGAEQIVEHVRTAAGLDVREVVLTGINLAAWGCGNTRRPEHARLGELLHRILADTSIPRIRLSSLGPQYLNQGFFDAFADPRVCDHLHLSVQSGSPSVLERMQRGHDVDTVFEVAARARSIRPDLALTADLIAGFPGESDAEFDETLQAVERLGLARVHVFPFSPRAGTPAATLPAQVPGALRKERAARLRRAGEVSRARFLETQWDKIRTVLVEQGEAGFTGNYLKLRVAGAAEGELVPTRVTPEGLLSR